MSTHAVTHPAERAAARAESGALRLVRKIGFILLAAFLALMTVLPLPVLLKVSISAPPDIMTAHPPFGIYNATLDHWRRILNSGELLSSSRHSFVVTCSAVRGWARSRSSTAAPSSRPVLPSTAFPPPSCHAAR